jgi:hypothetical protein
MATSLLTITFLVGLSLIVVSVLGGGIEVKELRIPTLPPIPRIATFVLGSSLVVMCIVNPRLFPDDAKDDSRRKVDVETASTDACSKSTTWLGQAIRDNIITVQQVKMVLRHVGKYSGEIDDKTDCQYKRAVVEFQASQNLDPDSYVGPVTYHKLREAWPEFFIEAKPAQDQLPKKLGAN